MADDELPTLDRRWRTSGDVADEVRLLTELVRAGRLTAAQVEVAARLGHPAAVRAVELRPEATLASFLAATPPSSAGRAVALRAGVAGARAIDALRDEDFASELDLVEDWLACPCGPHHAPLVELLQGCDPDEGALDPREPDLGRRSWHAITCLSDAAVRSRDDAALFDIARAIQVMEQFFPDVELLRPAREELVPWLLGRSDPLRVRVEDRAQRPNDQPNTHTST